MRQCLCYEVPIGPVSAQLVLPRDLSRAEADRICAIVRSLIIEPARMEVFGLGPRVVPSTAFHVLASVPGDKSGSRMYVSDQAGNSLTSDNEEASRLTADEVTAVSEYLRHRGYTGIEAILAK